MGNSLSYLDNILATLNPAPEFGCRANGTFPSMLERETAIR